MLQDIWMGFWTWIGDKNNLNIDIVTLFILAWTALEGFRSRRAANEANELKLLPLLCIYFEGKPKGLDTIFTIKNLGEGTAFDIKILPYCIKFTDSSTEWKFIASIPGTNLLDKTESKKLKVEMYENKKKVADSEFIAYAASGFYSEIQITFKNARGQNYFTLVRTTNESVNIEIPPKRLTVLWRIEIFVYNLSKNFITDIKVAILRIRNKKLKKYVGN